MILLAYDLAVPFPAFAGMNRTRCISAAKESPVPRTRGDELARARASDFGRHVLIRLVLFFRSTSFDRPCPKGFSAALRRSHA